MHADSFRGRKFKSIGVSPVLQFIQTSLKMALYDMNVFWLTTYEKIVNIKRAFDTWAESFNYWINFKAKKGDGQDATLRYTHFLST